MFFLDEIKKNKLSRKKFLLPLNDKDKRKGSMVYLLTPNYNSTLKLLSHPLLNNRYYYSYFMERSPFYYINSDKTATPASMVVEEVSLNKFEKENNVYFDGVEFDVDDLMRFITPQKLGDFERKYNTKINGKITFYINYPKNIQKCTNNEVYLLSRNKYDKEKYGTYSNYVDFMLYLLFAQIANPKINESLLISQALVLSGIYDIHRREGGFPFKQNVRTFCSAIKMYIDTFGEDKFINEIVIKNNTQLILIDIFKKKLKTSIDSCFDFNAKSFFCIKEEYNDELYYQGNEVIKEGIYLDNNVFLPLDESEKSYDAIIRKSLYKDRIKTNKDMLEKYKKIKEDLPFIKYTFLNVPMYKNMNLIYDLSYYNEIFFRNTDLPRLRMYKVYLDLMERMIIDDRLKSYSKKTVIIPVNDWCNNNENVWLLQDSVNPISCLYKSFLMNPNYFKSKYQDLDFVFLGSRSYFVINSKEIPNMDKFKPIFLKLIKMVSNGEIPTDDVDENENSPKAISVDIIEKIEKSQKLNISNITPSMAASSKPIKVNIKDEKKEKSDSTGAKEQNKDENTVEKEELKQELVDKVAQASSNARDVDDAIEMLDDDERVKDILSALASEPDDGPKISAARTSRLLKLQDDFMDKDFKGKKMSEILSYDDAYQNEKIEPISLNIDSVNPEWKELKYANVNEKYDLDKDLVSMFNFFHDKKYPLVIKDISVEDTSTSDDAIETYTVTYENEQGKRFTIIVDVPKLIDGKYMVLRGNRKNISSQLFPMPIMKTDENRVRVTSIYKEIFIERFGTTFGKTNVVTDRLVKTLKKGKFKNLRLLEGDNTRVCTKYEVPIDYIDIGSAYSEIETEHFLFQFNQDKLRKEYGDKIDLKSGFPCGIDKRNKSIIYYTPVKDNFIFFSTMLKYWLETELDGFNEVYDSTTTSVKYTFSQASILGSKIPLIVVCAYSEGLERVMKKAGIQYDLSEKRPLFDKDQFDIIRFKDGFLKYKLDYNSSLLMNGLKVCDTEDFSLSEINQRTTYLNFLDMFGGRIKADGLDNFYELFIDKPITYNSLIYYKLPTDYISLLLYANQLLTDNKFIKHADITSSRRIRHNELIADLLYREVLSKAYGEYCTSIKHRGQGVFSVKRNALVNAVLLNNTTEDQSIINALNEYEAYNTVTPKGPGGLNTERAYTLDKRSYDDSMLNVLSMSTSFADKVGIPRQATIDANIEGYRGFVTSNSEDNISEINPTKTLCMTEALTPYGITRDDPFRSAMNFVQTSKHEMRCRKSDPSLITTGADEALPYLTSNTFSYKAKDDGKVIEKDDDHMIIEYKAVNGEPSYDYIDLTENVEKNSSSGFFVTLKLDSDLKVGNKVKKDEIVAYDKTSFSDEMGYNDNIAYNIGTLCKFAILNTDEGYEDSAIISKDMSQYMTADIVLKKEVSLPKGTNVYNMVKKGQAIKEGDPLLIIQNTYDEDDVNTLLKNLVGDENDITELGRRPIRSKVTGVVEDIVISRTVEIDELSDSLKKIVTNYEKDINKKKKIMKQYGIHKETELPATEKLPATGKLKNSDDGVLIEFYLKYEDKMGVGDKLVYYSALKGVVKDIFPEGKEPTSEFRPNEKIHSLLSIGSVNGRMTCSILINSVINKGLIELSRKVKDILDIPYDDNL